MIDHVREVIRESLEESLAVTSFNPGSITEIPVKSLFLIDANANVQYITITTLTSTEFLTNE